MINLLEEIGNAASIAISGHIRPDGDCVGSCMGMALYLRKLLPGCRIDVMLESVRPEFFVIKDADKVYTGEPDDSSYDVFIALDCDKTRLGRYASVFDHAKKTINIDHHISNQGCADVNYIAPDASSASELVYNLVDKSQLDADIATPLYIGIIHDTGVMQYSNTAPVTLRAVADLIACGIPFTRFIDETFYEKSYDQTLIMGHAVNNSKLVLDGRCAYTYVSRADMTAYHVGPKDLDGIINRLKYIRGVECAMFAYELEPGHFKFSLRTSDRVDAAAISVSYGGGGHKKAAGFEMQGEVSECIADVLKKIAQELEK